MVSALALVATSVNVATIDAEAASLGTIEVGTETSVGLIDSYWSSSYEFTITDAGYYYIGTSQDTTSVGGLGYATLIVINDSDGNCAVMESTYWDGNPYTTTLAYLDEGTYYYYPLLSDWGSIYASNLIDVNYNFIVREAVANDFIAAGWIGSNDLEVSPDTSFDMDAVELINSCLTDWYGCDEISADDYTYKWCIINYDNDGSWDEIEGETNSTCTISDGVDTATDYVCSVSTSDGTWLAGIYFSVTVENGFTAKAVSDTEVTAVKGDSVTLEALGTANVGAISYSWYDESDASTILATTAAYTFAASSTTTICCDVSDKYGTCITLSFDVTVKESADSYGVAYIDIFNTTDWTPTYYRGYACVDGTDYSYDGTNITGDGTYKVYIYAEDVGRGITADDAMNVIVVDIKSMLDELGVSSADDLDGVVTVSDVSLEFDGVEVTLVQDNVSLSGSSGSDEASLRINIASIWDSSDDAYTGTIAFEEYVCVTFTIAGLSDVEPTVETPSSDSTSDSTGGTSGSTSSTESGSTSGTESSTTTGTTSTTSAQTSEPTTYILFIVCIAALAGVVFTMKKAR